MDSAEELRTLRARVEAVEQALSVMAWVDVAGGVARAVKTISRGNYPTTGQRKMFAVAPLDVTGGDEEGSSGTATEQGGWFLAINLGPGRPPEGKELLVYDVGRCWAFWYA